MKVLKKILPIVIIVVVAGLVYSFFHIDGREIKNIKKLSSDCRVSVVVSDTYGKPYYFEDGILFSITDSMNAEEQYNGLRVIKFDAQKWRSGTGAYYFGDCTASWPQNGTWSDYNIGSQAIS